MPALPDKLPGSRNAPTRTGCAGSGAAVKPLLQVAGGLGFAGVLLGIVILVASCAGFSAALYFSPAVILLGFVNLILTLIAARRSSNDSSILASLFLTVLATIGGLIELAVWLHWPIMFNQPL